MRVLFNNAPPAVIAGLNPHLCVEPRGDITVFTVTYLDMHTDIEYQQQVSISQATVASYRPEIIGHVMQDMLEGMLSGVMRAWCRAT